MSEAILRQSYRLIVVAVGMAACGHQPSPAVSAAPTAGEYQGLLARALHHDTTLDFGALRLAYTKTDAYHPYGVDEKDLGDSATAAINASNLPLARHWLDSLLAIDYTYLRGHVLAVYVADQMNDSTVHDLQVWTTGGLLRSIDQSGNGTSSRPFIVISVDEEYAWARLRGFKPAGNQALAQCGSHACDATGFTNRETGADTTIYFDVSIPFGQMSREMNGKP